MQRSTFRLEAHHTARPSTSAVILVMLGVDASRIRITLGASVVALTCSSLASRSVVSRPATLICHIDVDRFGYSPFNVPRILLRVWTYLSLKLSSLGSSYLSCFFYSDDLSTSGNQGSKPRGTYSLSIGLCASTPPYDNSFVPFQFSPTSPFAHAGVLAQGLKEKVQPLTK